MARELLQELDGDGEDVDQVQMALGSTLITLLLLVLIGFAMWQRYGGRAPATTAMPAAGVERTAAAAVEPTPPVGVFAGPRSLGIDEAVRMADDSSSIPRIYFVASADVETDVLNRIAEENRLRYANGAAARRVKVVIVNSNEHASAWIGSMQDSDAIRAELGAPPYEIINLRTPSDTSLGQTR